MPPWTIPNWSLGFSRRSNSSREPLRPAKREAHRAAASSSVAGSGVHSSKIIAISEFRLRCILHRDFGVRNSLAPSIGDENLTPFADLAQRASENTLEPARVGKSGFASEPQAAMQVDDFHARPQPWVKVLPDRFERRFRPERPGVMA